MGSAPMLSGRVSSLALPTCSSCKACGQIVAGETPKFLGKTKQCHSNPSWFPCQVLPTLKNTRSNQNPCISHHNTTENELRKQRNQTPTMSLHTGGSEKWRLQLPQSCGQLGQRVAAQLNHMQVMQPQSLAAELGGYQLDIILCIIYIYIFYTYYHYLEDTPIIHKKWFMNPGLTLLMFMGCASSLGVPAHNSCPECC